jgi:hypothetical protein
MDLSLGDSIDTLCSCGNQAQGYVYGVDGARRYVCRDCANDLRRHKDGRFAHDLPDHPRARRCRACEKMTLLEAMDVRGVCEDCQGEQAAQENEAVVEAIQQDQAEAGTEDE